MRQSERPKKSRVRLLQGARTDFKETTLEKRGTAIHVDGLAGDGARLRGAEEERRAGDFVRGLPASLQNRAQETGELFFGAHA